MKRQLTCIICPRGCTLTVDTDADPIAVTGNSCPRGKTYGIAECTAPERTVTSVMPLTNRPDETVSVKTDRPVKKQDMFRVMEILRQSTAAAPIHRGDVLVPDACGSQIIATEDVE